MTQDSSNRPRPPAPPSPAESREALERGELVGLPTESAYGVAARAGGEALARLRGLPIADAPANPTLLAADAAGADPWVSTWIAPARRLRDRYWPGPLVLLLPSGPAAPRGLAPDGDSWVPVRVPAHPFTRAVLDGLPFPVAFRSAAAAGAPLPAAREDLPEEIRRAIGRAAAVAGGALGQEPAIARVGPGRFEVLREGILTADDLRRTAGRRILLVCTGNTCRSAMAAPWLRARLVERLGGGRAMPPEAQIRFLASFGYRVESAGTGPMPDAPATPFAIESLREHQLSLEGHRAREATRELLAEFDLVLAMSERHRQRLLELAPSSASVERLNPDSEIEDPYGLPLEVYRATLKEIAAAIEKRLPDL